MYLVSRKGTSTVPLSLEPHDAALYQLSHQANWELVIQ